MISRKKALSLMMESKGRFFTVCFTKKDGKDRVMNCQYIKDDSSLHLGYLRVKDIAIGKKTTSNYRSINLQTLKSITINGKSYRVK